MPRTRQKATDFFDTPSQETAQTPRDDGASAGRSVELRRSARLESPSVAKAQRKTGLEKGVAARNSPRVTNSTPVSSNKTQSASRARKLSNESQSADDVFVDAMEEVTNTPITPHLVPKAEVSVVIVKSPLTEEPYMSAFEDHDELSGALASAETDNTDEEDEVSDRSTPRPSTTQNTLDKIPSSQPRPRTQRSPIPLKPTPSSPPVSLPASTPLSAIASTLDSITVVPPPIKTTEPENSEEEDSDDDAPEAISLSTSRSQALAAQSQISDATKIRAEKQRGKRRQRDQLLASQRQDRLKALEEVPNSQQSTTDISGNTTDNTPAPNQEHQATKVAERHAHALPSAILQAASDTWLQVSQPEKANVERPKKRKERDDGVRILEDVNARLAPKKGKISVSKEKMIMRMGRGERKMYIGRFART
jgi:hypothetical protein